MRLEKIVSNQNKLREHNLDTAYFRSTTARWKIKLKTIEKIKKKRGGIEKYFPYSTNATPSS